MTCCNKGYCESLEKILCSEAELTEYLLFTFYCEVIKWIESIPEEDKKIKLYTDVMAAYTNRTCAVSSLVCSAKELLEKCSIRENKCSKKLSENVYILEKVKFIKKCSCEEKLYFVVYDSCTKKTKLCKYNKEYDDDCLSTSIYFFD